MFQFWKWNKYWSELCCLPWQAVIMKRQEASEEFTWVNIQTNSEAHKNLQVEFKWTVLYTENINLTN